MRSIKTKEEEVISEFKNIVLENLPITVLYADSAKVESYISSGFSRVDPMYMAFRDTEKSRLPVIGLNTITIGHSHFIMEGVVHVIKREDFNNVIEQFHTVESNEKIFISEVSISTTEFYNSHVHSNLCVISGKFTVEYRE